MNDLLEICNFIIFFIETMQNPNENNQELSKWFQLIHQGILIGLLDERTLYQSLNSNRFDLNHNSLIDICKKMICDNHSFQEESKNDKKSKLFGKNDFSLKDSFFILLGLTLDEKQNAIHPYLLFTNDIKPYMNFIKDDMVVDKIISIVNTIFKVDKTKVDNIGAVAYHTLLIQFIPKLKDEKRCIELINKAHKFIREANEN